MKYYVLSWRLLPRSREALIIICSPQEKSRVKSRLSLHSTTGLQADGTRWTGAPSLPNGSDGSVATTPAEIMCILPPRPLLSGGRSGGDELPLRRRNGPLPLPDGGVVAWPILVKQSPLQSWQ